MVTAVEIGPQPGPQTDALCSAADILVFGGAAGSGKTFSLLLEPLRHIKNPQFDAVFFRRTYPQIANPGGLWDKSVELYGPTGAKGTSGTLWRFSSGATVRFSHMQYEGDKLNWQGSEIPLIGFDELTQFSMSQFFYLLSRNRSMSGIRPYIRATCNPDPDSWVARFIAWWIDQDTGYPIPERAGKLRWFIRMNDEIIWAASARELEEEYGALRPDLFLPGSGPKSVTFIPAKLADNRKLLEKDPGYLANLLALPLVEREQLLGGNWKIRAAAGMVFQRDKFQFLDEAPPDLDWVRFWDLAATDPREGKDPDYLAGCKMAWDPNTGFIYIGDMRRMRGRPAEVEAMLSATADADGTSVEIYFEQEPGSSGKALIDQYSRHLLAGYSVRTLVASQRGNKLALASPFSSAVERGHVCLVRGSWNDAFLAEAEAFTGGNQKSHDDQIDAASSAYNIVTGAAWRTGRSKRRVAAGYIEAMERKIGKCISCGNPIYLPVGIPEIMCPMCGARNTRDVPAGVPSYNPDAR